MSRYPGGEGSPLWSRPNTPKGVSITDEQWEDAVKDRINSHAVDHLSRLWQYFRASGIGKGENGFHATDAVRAVTGNDPMGLEQFFRNNAEALACIRCAIGARRKQSVTWRAGGLLPAARRQP